MDVIEIESSDSESDFEDEDEDDDDEFNHMHLSRTDTQLQQSSGLFGVAREGLGSESCNTDSYVLEKRTPSVKTPLTCSAFDTTSKNQETNFSVPSSQNHHSETTKQLSLGSHNGLALYLDQKECVVLEDDWESESTSYAQERWNDHGNFEQTASKRFFPSSSQPNTISEASTSKNKGKGNLDLKSSAFHGSAGTLNNGPNFSPERRVDVYAQGTYEKSLGHGEDRHIEDSDTNLNLPKLKDDISDGLLTVPLLKHQKIALAWMVEREKNTTCAGGILADDQGLGKTISMIALIQKQKFEQTRHASGGSYDRKPEALDIDVELDQVNYKKKSIGADDGKHDTVGVMQSDQLDDKQILTGADGNRHVVIASKLKRSYDNSRPAGGTLIVCPASVLRQWARELDEKVPRGAKLSILVYHGGTRTKHPTDLTKYDVVLTTYAIVANEVPKLSTDDDDDVDQKNADRYGLYQDFSSNNKRKQNNDEPRRQKKKRKGLDDSNLGIAGGALARVRWFRVILDEVQTIKNHRTRVARACCSFHAKARWCLSGTPVQNAIDDLFSYFRFLKFEPYDNYNKFDLLVKIPISRNAVQGYKKLQAVLKTMLLRRTKETLIDGEPILKLPPKSTCLKRIEFSEEEREFYFRLEADIRRQFKEFDAAGTVQQNYANILVMLLRLRQACDHPFLVNNGTHSDIISKESLGMAKQLPMDMLTNLLNELEGSFAICGSCSDPPEDAVVTMCCHVFCYQCVSDRLTGEDNSCPAHGCKEVLGADLVFSKSTLRSCISGNFDGNASMNCFAFEDSFICNNSYVSTKIRATIEILKQLSGPSSGVSQTVFGSESSPIRSHKHFVTGSSSDANGMGFSTTQSKSKTDVPDKAIVFSQWTGMLDLLESSLNQELIQYRRLDGSMPLNLRDKAVKDFNNDAEVVVMLMSLKAGSLGLNMVAACRVILLDMWWNPTTEDQAIDRAHRIGQTRPVIVSRLTIKNTVEDRILTLQEEKRKMVASCFGENADGNIATYLTMEDVRYLIFGG